MGLACRVIGYTNLYGTSSVPLITIARYKQSFYAIYPDLTKKELDLDSVEDILKHNEVIAENSERYIKADQLSYLSSSGIIFIENETKLVEIVKKDLRESDKSSIWHEFLNDYLLEIEIINSSTQKKKKLKDIIIFTTERVKKNKEVAKRVIIQYLKNGSRKTCYRKNLFTNDPVQEDLRFMKSFTRIIEIISNLGDVSALLKFKEATT